MTDSPERNVNANNALSVAKRARVQELTRLIAEAQAELQELLDDGGGAGFAGNDGEYPRAQTHLTPYDELEVRNQELMLLNRVISIGAEMQELQVTLDAIVREVAMGFQVPRAGLALLEESGTHLRIASEFLAAGTTSAIGELIPIQDNSATEFVIREMKALAIFDVQSDPRLARVRKLLHSHGIASILLVPLVTRNRVVGTLGLDSYTPRHFTEREITLATNIATTLAGTIENARLMDMTRRRIIELAALEVVTVALRMSTAQEEVMPAVLAQVAKLANAVSASLVLKDNSTNELYIKHIHGPPHGLLANRVPFEGSLTGQVMQQAEPKPVVFPSLLLEKSYIDAESLGRDYTAIAIPLIVNGKSIGVIWLLCEEEISTALLTLLASIGDIAASAIHRSVLYEQLQGQAQRLQRVMETVQTGLLLLDRERHVLLANPAARRDLLFLNGDDDPEQLTHLAGRPIEEFLSVEGAAMPSRRIDIEHRAPERRIYTVVTNPVAAGSGYEGWVMSLRDVTYRREMERRILQQDRLAAVGQLAAGIAHDFNNVIAVISLYSQMLQNSQSLSEIDRRRVGTIHQQAQHAANLIRQILDFSRQSPMQRGTLDLDPLLVEIVQLWERTLPELIRIEFVSDGGEHLTFGEPNSLRQALTNLALNARDAMPEGGLLRIELSIVQLAPGDERLLPEQTPGEWLRLTVADSGVGISPANLARIFDPFFSTKDPTQGTGLGLAQVYGIVKQHDGYITVDSRINEGTTFTIYLPPLAQVQAEGGAADETGGPLARDERVMVVEDDAVTRMAVQSQLESLGYRVLAMKSGLEALDWFHSGEMVELVLSDATLPDMSGIELFEALNAEFPSVRMVLMTSYALDARGRQLFETGALFWIQKPFSGTNLARQVRLALDSRSSG